LLGTGSAVGLVACALGQQPRRILGAPVDLYEPAVDEVRVGWVTGHHVQIGLEYQAGTAQSHEAPPAVRLGLHIQQFQLPFAMRLDHGEMSIGDSQAVIQEKRAWFMPPRAGAVSINSEQPITDRPDLPHV
jgi:hypothetical protein